MARKPSQLGRGVALLVIGALVGALFITPAGAHVGGTVRHVWTKHLAPLAKKVFYTKARSDARYQRKGGTFKIVGTSGNTTDGLEVGKFNNGSSSELGPGTYCHWSNFGSTHTPAGYKLDREGMVQLVGVIKATGGAFICGSRPKDYWIFKLPAKLAPDQQVVFLAWGQTDHVRINVDTNGIVSLGSDVDADWGDAQAAISLDGLQFPVDHPS